MGIITMVTFVYLNIQLNIRSYVFIMYTGFIESVYFIPRPPIVYLLSPSWSHRLFLFVGRWKSPHDSFLKSSMSPNERGETAAPPQPASRCRLRRAGSGNKARDPGAAPRGQRDDIRVSVLWGCRGACVSGGCSRALWSVFFIKP